MTQEELDRLRQLHEQASPGPWGWVIRQGLCGEYTSRIMRGPQTIIGDGYGALDGAKEEDLDLLVEARNALPALLDEISRLQAELERNQPNE